eukprot:613435-Rhodomonas_salina.1
MSVSNSDKDAKISGLQAEIAKSGAEFAAAKEEEKEERRKRTREMQDLSTQLTSAKAEVYRP